MKNKSRAHLFSLFSVIVLLLLIAFPQASKDGTEVVTEAPVQSEPVFEVPALFEVPEEFDEAAADISLEQNSPGWEPVIEVEHSVPDAENLPEPAASQALANPTYYFIDPVPLAPAASYLCDPKNDPNEPTPVHCAIGRLLQCCKPNETCKRIFADTPLCYNPCEIKKDGRTKPCRGAEDKAGVAYFCCKPEQLCASDAIGTPLCINPDPLYQCGEHQWHPDFVCCAGKKFRPGSQCCAEKGACRPGSKCCGTHCIIDGSGGHCCADGEGGERYPCSKGKTCCGGKCCGPTEACGERVDPASGIAEKVCIEVIT